MLVSQYFTCSSEITHSNQSFNSRNLLIEFSSAMALFNTPLLFPFPEKDDLKPEKVTTKWAINNSKYEIHTNQLDSIELKHLVPHCITVRHEINNVVSTGAHKGPSLFRAFPRTLSFVLEGVWRNVLEDADNNDETVDNFDARLRDFIAVHCTETDGYGFEYTFLGSPF